MHTRIFLLGFMGSGKTFWARHLSRALDLPLIELDEEIVRQEEQSISEIFSSRGEAYFRELEHAKLVEAMQRDMFVLSTGGGLPCYFDHMDLMNRSGLTLWLNASVPAMVSRLKKGRERRPLIKDLDDEGLASFVAAKLEARRPFYEKAHLTVDPSVETVESFIVKIKSCKSPI